MTSKRLTPAERAELRLEIGRALGQSRTLDLVHTLVEDTAAYERERIAPLVEALRPWLRHHVWCNCKTDDPPTTKRCKCGLRATLDQ